MSDSTLEIGEDFHMASRFSSLEIGKEYYAICRVNCHYSPSYISNSEELMRRHIGIQLLVPNLINITDDKDKAEALTRGSLFLTVVKFTIKLHQNGITIEVL